MASVYDLKPAFSRLLRPLVAYLASHGVTANQVTVGAALLSLVTGLTVGCLAPVRPGYFLLLPTVLLVRMGLNAIDGMLAREHGQKSQLGAFLNELGDVLSDAGLYLPLAWLPWVTSELVVLFALVAALTELAGVVSQSLGKSRRYDGPMGKSDRAFLVGAIGLALGLGVAPG
ncbi:MAG: CDP-alcohol phosphatidyltransferase family protein, partial [Candidatus Eremiobacteraeota bacterium]|nr:CDP-alcohol phosphatidyltransferase family protein [Candidatus Eremiobacteraeota bacterium]